MKEGNFPDFVQSNLPLSTTTPAMVVPCPPIHFVALWTLGTCKTWIRNRDRALVVRTDNVRAVGNRAKYVSWSGESL